MRVISTNSLRDNGEAHVDSTHYVCVPNTITRSDGNTGYSSRNKTPPYECGNDCLRQHTFFHPSNRTSWSFERYRRLRHFF